ncbi:MAG: restriction endonuclease subunit S [Bacteroidales bacterium]|nr:restriction endonuclease subunit S [Bacteroidales bacterium]
MSKVSKTTLGDLIEFQRGYDLPKSKFVNGEYPVQSSNGILGYHNEYKVKGPGITIGRSGTVGLPHLIKSNFYPHNTALFIKDFKNNDVEYIFYLLKNLKLGDKKSGSGVPTMNRNHLHPLKIVAHLNIQTQKTIAKVLSDLDAKIELNNKINRELEAMAKTLYDYWFVQFDFPFDFAQGKPNEQGKPYKSSGGKMVYNAELKREIPEGWEVKTINSIIDVKDGTHDSPKPKEKGFSLITSKNLLVSGLDFENANLISEDDYHNINNSSFAVPKVQ